VETITTHCPGAREPTAYVDTEPAASNELDLAEGLRLGHFEIIRRLGSGGMGVVYEAIDDRLGRAVALKLVRGDCEGGDARLLDEARAMARVRHAAVLTVFEAGELDGSVYLAAELIRGTTLRQYVEQHRPAPAQIFALYRRAAEGLAAAHAHGIIHRDFKPDNVFVENGAETRVLVGDFGLATAMARRVLAVGSGAAGTPAYMAPEQMDDGAFDERVDVFAFCVSLWEALFGARPFAGQTLAELRVAMDVTPSRPPAPHVPRRIGELLTRGLAVEPAERPRLDELIAALRPRSTRTRARVAAGLGVVALAATAIAWSRTPPVDVGVECLAAPTPAEVTASWSTIAVAAHVPSWVRRRIAATLDARDHEVVALQRSVCATTDDAVRRAWVSCRRDHAIQEAALARALATPWPAYDQLDDALELPWPSTCASRAARLDAVLDPSEPRDREMLDDARRELASSRLAALSGAPPARWRDLLARARAIPAPLQTTIEVEALLDEAAYTRELASKPRLDRIEHAVELAERGGYLTATARGWLALALARGDAQVDQAAIDLAFTQASWAIERAGDPPMLRARWHAASAARAWQRSDLAAVDVHARAAAALAGDDPHRRRIAVLALAAAAASHADFAAQRTLLESLLADPLVATATDADTARLQALYAECLYHLDLLDLAAPAAERAIATARAVAGDRDPMTAQYLLIRGFIQLDRGDAAGCARTVDEALATLTPAIGKDHLSIGAALNLRASARAAVKDWRGALADSETAAALFEAKLGPRAEQVIFARMQIGDNAKMVGDLEHARASLARALDDARATYGADDPRTADVEWSVADLLVTDHHVAEARALLEHALSAHEKAHTPAAYLAHVQASLAKLVDDRGRARALARQALAAWRGDPGWIEEYADLERWMRRRRT
jgi:hypothetical protein